MITTLYPFPVQDAASATKALNYLLPMIFDGTVHAYFTSCSLLNRAVPHTLIFVVSTEGTPLGFECSYSWGNITNIPLHTLDATVQEQCSAIAASLLLASIEDTVLHFFVLVYDRLES